MSIRTVRYLRCDYCPCRGVRLDEGDPWPQGWRVTNPHANAPRSENPEPAKHACPNCASTNPQTIPKISEVPHAPTIHGAERFVVGEAADDTGDA